LSRNRWIFDFATIERKRIVKLSCYYSDIFRENLISGIVKTLIFAKQSYIYLLNWSYIWFENFIELLVFLSFWIHNNKNHIIELVSIVANNCIIILSLYFHKTRISLLNIQFRILKQSVPLNKPIWRKYKQKSENILS